MTREAQRVAVVMLDHHMGNSVVALPTVAALARHYEAGVDLLIDRRWAGIAQQMRVPTSTVRVVPIDVRNAHGGRGFAAQLRSVEQVLRLRGKYDVVIDLTGTKRGNLATWLTGAPVRVGQGWSERPWCFTQRLDTNRVTHCRQLYGQMLAFIDADNRPPAVMLHSTEKCQASVERWLTPLAGKPFVVMHASAGKSFREWPPVRFAAVANALHQSAGLACVVIGTPGDRPTAETIFADLQNDVTRLFVSSSPADLVALFERAALLISNESGPTHVAAATEVPIVTIFGPTSETLWRPIRDENIAVLRGAPCDPACGKRQCVADNRCLKSLCVDQVINAAEALLARG